MQDIYLSIGGLAIISEKLVNIEKILRDHEKGIMKLDGKGKENVIKKKENASSMMDFIMGMKDNKVFDKSKFLKEIINELARRGHHYNAISVTKPLQRAVRQMKLGRVGEKGKWQYTRR